MRILPILFRRKRRLLIVVAALVLGAFYLSTTPQATTTTARKQLKTWPARASRRRIAYVKSTVDWAQRAPKYPVAADDLVRLPPGLNFSLSGPDYEASVYDEAAPARIQYNFRADPDYKAADNTLLRNTRRDAVRATFKRAWAAYRRHAWGYDELRPLSLAGKDSSAGAGAGWGATLVDGLDTLWIMGLHDEFDEAVRAVATIDWDAATSPASAAACSLHETNVRYLGGLLAAYEMSGAAPLLAKATELAYMLLAAFDTPSHMPADELHLERAFQGRLVPGDHVAAAAVGSLSLEFTKVAQLTGDDRFYDAIDRIKRELARIQDTTTLPGLWPTFLDLQKGPITVSSVVGGGGGGNDEYEYTLGGFADALYEYLPKMYQLLGGTDDTYRSMYVKAADAARKHLLFRPMIPDPPDVRGHDIKMAGTVLAKPSIGGAGRQLVPDVQHQACFAGGMFALGGRLFDRPADVDTGMQLARGCAWAYSAFPTGLMPETLGLVPCPGSGPNSGPDSAMCPWDEKAYRKAVPPQHDVRCPPGVAKIHDPRYMLRAEAVESVFLLYRTTGDRSLPETAWSMYQAIAQWTATEEANAALADVSDKETQKIDSMGDSFFSETLKYLFLTFSDPDTFSLDEYVYNTKAHPFKVPRRRRASNGAKG